MLFNVRIDRIKPQYFISTEVDRNTHWRQVSSETHGGPRAQTHAKWEK